ncbi:MAG: NADPH:quinone reductase [Alphaproteobacteria bacterium]|nr:MAG: NADPH:quinone reductase [Alphaproteobacteria bacterium]
MRAAFYRRTGPAAEVLELGTLPDPEPGPGEVLVRLRASGINPADVKRRAGWRGAGMDHPLVIPHADGAGEIVGLGAGVDPARLGQRVWLWNAQGGYGAPGRAFGTAAELIALPAEQAVPLPAALGFAAGACLGIPAMTAHRTVFADGPVAGQTVLIAGAGGAVAHFAVQFARHGGARVIGTAGSPERAAHARAAGAEAVIDRHAEDVAAWVMDLTGGQGVDRVIEVDFAANQATDLAVLKPNGIIAAYSSTSDPAPMLDYYGLQTKGATLRTIQGFSLPETARRAGEAAIAELAAAGALRVAIGRRLPLERIAEAHDLVERGAVIGNVVLEIG